MAHLESVFYLCLILALGGASMVSPGASAPGDILIAGFFPVHEGVEKNTNLSHPEPYKCVKFNKEGLTNALAMVHAVESLNGSPVLGGLTLGYHLYDSCSDVSTALQVTQALVDVIIDCWTEPTDTSCSQPVMAVIGATSSEVSIAVARQLTLELIPQISYASSAVILSDKNRFPAFMRTVPNDNYQTRAMVKLLKDNDWNWVGMVSTDGDYGRSALESFMAEATDAGICVAFREILPDILSNDSIMEKINKTAKSIVSTQKVNVIVSFAKPMHMIYLFNALDEETLQKKVWVASDGWSTSRDVIDKMKDKNIGTVVGFTFKRGDILPFHDFLSTLNITGSLENSSFMREFSTLQNQSRHYSPGQSGLLTDVLINSTQPDAVFSIHMAVSAIAHAAGRLCTKKDCRAPKRVEPWELLQELEESEFELDGKSYAFDSNGDVNLGYDVTLWRSGQEAVQIDNVVAEYSPQTHSFNFRSKNTRKKLQELQQVESKCAPTCQPGQVKTTAEGQHTCCYSCVNCTENHFSNGTDMDQCFRCDKDTEWATAGSSSCTAKTLEFFSWQDHFAAVLLLLASAGVLLTFLVSALFLWYRKTPVAKAAGGPISQLLLFSLVGSYVSTVLFVGQPTNLQCQVRQVVFGLSFTWCVACILVKSLKILLAFHFNPGLQAALRKLYQPYWIIGVCVGLQALLCTLWLVLSSPQEKRVSLETSILVECDEGSYVAFGVMLVYIAVLALVCFGCAFKGRKLPENYNEAKFITFSMLIYFITWVIFGPVYVTTSGKYLPAVEMVVILISNYGILSCNFFPKCYIMLFRKQANTKDAFLQDIYAYTSRQSGKIKMDGSVHENLPTRGKLRDSLHSVSTLSSHLPETPERERALKLNVSEKSFSALVQDPTSPSFCRRRNASV
ncbi:hypothetical protein MATL_G00134210 [Megalops atlanticus]|uniref:G-protein coupled receptor family C group 6 member A n=1 Tax=Megalops atlanticus TaxID=7932 RepID=A0A9D3T4Y9_MEGAT|nr:hypothetical protein MATL_G00134210 [Megalops atlanticus]